MLKAALLRPGWARLNGELNDDHLAGLTPDRLIDFGKSLILLPRRNEIASIEPQTDNRMVSYANLKSGWAILPPDFPEIIGCLIS